MSEHTVYLLLLIVIANGAPVVAAKLFATRLSMPIDAGRSYNDGRRLLGDSKTWRGIVASIVLTCLVSMLLEYGLLAGLIISLAAMCGDLLSSFVKRRMGLPTSAMAPLIDQVPESLLPTLLMKHSLLLDDVDAILLVIAFVVIEILLSQLLFRVGIRNRPY